MTVAVRGICMYVCVCVCVFLYRADASWVLIIILSNNSSLSNARDERVHRRHEDKHG